MIEWNNVFIIAVCVTIQNYDDKPNNYSYNKN